MSLSSQLAERGLKVPGPAGPDHRSCPGGAPRPQPGAPAGGRLAAPVLDPYPSPAAVPTVLALVGLLVVAMWWRDATPGSVQGFGPLVTALGNVLGLVGAYLVLVQLLLLARVRWFERAVGLDRLAAWHRALGTNVVVTLCLHALLVTVGYSATGHSGLLGEPFRLLHLFRFVAEAALALAIFVAVAVTSARAARRRLSYEAWYWIHVSVYVAVALAVLHQLASGVDFVGHPLNQALWILLYLVVAGCILTARLGAPVRAYLRHRLRVEAVVPEAPGVVSVWVRGHDLDALRAEAGQFFLWRFLVRGHLLSAHPYSVSAVPGRGRLRITVKTAGDHSGRLARLRQGDRVVAEGPFGHFTLRRRTRDRCLLVAGGSGVAPIRALAEALARSRPARPDDVVLLYRVSSPEDLLFRHEFDAMARHGLLTVHYLVGRRRQLGFDPLGPSGIHRLVPDVASRDVWMCGPEGMSAATRASLRRLRVPPRQVHLERFSLW